MDLIRYGDEGYLVMLLQYALQRAGQDPGQLDGLFGRKTLKALQAFQRAEGLMSDGVAGRLTWAALYPYITGYRLHKLTAGDTFYELGRRYGIDYQKIIVANPNFDPENLPIGETVTIPLPMDVVAQVIPYSFLLAELVIQGLRMRYPFIGRYEIGRSVMGRPLTALSMGSGQKQVGYNAAHHANEWITTPVLLLFLEEYAKAYAENGTVDGVSARSLFELATLHAVPLVNPDGVDLVTGALAPGDSFYEQARALAAYYPQIPFPEGWKANIQGVDLNLQYPAGWDIARSIKFARGFTRPGPRDYVGSAPLSAVESRAMADWTQAHDFSLILAYHTQGKTIYWRYADYSVPGAREIGLSFAARSGYSLESTPYVSDHAGYKDWFIQTWLRPGYTIEAGLGENPLPLAQLPEIYADNRPILVGGLTLSP